MRMVGTSGGNQSATAGTRAVAKSTGANLRRDNEMWNAPGRTRTCGQAHRNGVASALSRAAGAASVRGSGQDTRENTANQPSKPQRGRRSPLADWRVGALAVLAAGVLSGCGDARAAAPSPAAAGVVVRRLPDAGYENLFRITDAATGVTCYLADRLDIGTVAIACVGGAR